MDWLLECAPTTTFQNPPPIERDTAGFRMTLRDGQIRFEFNEHHASVRSAQDSLANFLRAWEIDAGLRIGAGEIQFVYERAGITDRNPPPPGEAQVIGLQGIASGEAFGIGTIRLSRSSYPEPPKAFTVSPNVETLWQRYEGYLENREPLSSMAYFCLTVIENSVGQQSGRRKAAAAKYNVHLDVLNKLGEITERRGDPATARKMNANLVPHTRREIEWIETAVKAIIRRVGEVEADASVQQIALGDRPAM